jgi:hypothetical protein
MLSTKIIMKNKFLGKKRNIKRKTREETRRIFLIKASTQRRIVHHNIKMMIVTMTQKMYSLWILKMMKRIMKNEVRYILKHN